jgi:hypothetical protein
MTTCILLSFGYKVLCVNKPATHCSGQRSGNFNAHIPFGVQSIGKTVHKGKQQHGLKEKVQADDNNEVKIVIKICILFTKVNFFCA